MAPFRSSARSNRVGRGQTEQDVFAGLPVRQWRQTEGIFGLPPPEILKQDKDLIFPELPMPRDANQLALHTQLLLREARKPRSAKRKAEPTLEVKADDEEETKDHQISRGWSGKKWSQTPASMEGPDPEYLAKRRKGLASTYVEAPAFVPQIATRTAKVKKFDEAGQQIIYEVIVPEGQTIEGEVRDEDVSMLQAPALAPGTVVEGVGVANAEGQVIANDLLQPGASRRRKPPPPKRKGGPGRGKKKVMFQRPTASDGATGTGPTTPTTSAGTPTAFTSGGIGVEGDEDDGDEGEEGEEGEEDDHEDGELSEGEITEPAAEAAPADHTAPPDTAMPDMSIQPATLDEPAVPVEELMPPPPVSTLATEPLEPLPTPAEPVSALEPAVPISAIDSSLEALQNSSHEVAPIPGLQTLPATSAEDVSTGTALDQPAADPVSGGEGQRIEDSEPAAVVNDVVTEPTSAAVPSGDASGTEEVTTVDNTASIAASIEAPGPEAEGPERTAPAENGQ